MQDLAHTLRIVMILWSLAPAGYSNRYIMTDPHPQVFGLSGMTMSVIGYVGYAIVIALSLWYLFEPPRSLTAPLARKWSVRSAKAVGIVLMVVSVLGSLVFLGNAYRYINHVGYSRVDEVMESLVGAWWLFILGMWAATTLLQELCPKPETRACTA